MRSVLKAVYVDTECSAVRQNVAADRDGNVTLYALHIYFAVRAR